MEQVEPLGGQDVGFLAFERAGLPMHVGALLLLDVPASLRAEDGEPDLPALCSLLAARLRGIPRLEQHLERRGLLRRPVWTSRPGARPEDHIRALRLPAPGSRAQLEELSGDFLARGLDRSRPLWELRVVAGVDGGKQVALLCKLHHALLDGSAGVALLHALFGEGAALDGASHAAPARPAPARRAGRVPTASDERASAGGCVSRRPRPTRRSGGSGLARFLRAAWPPLPRSPLTGPVAAHRQVRTVELDEAPLERIRRATGATRNDVLLAVVAAAVQRHLGASGRRRPRVRAFCPVDLRAEAERGRLGNRLGAMLVELPPERDPRAVLRALPRHTRHARRSGQAGGLDAVGRWAAFLPAWLLRAAMALAGRLRLYNLVVSHVRLPAGSLALGPAGLSSLHAFAPLFARQRLAVVALGDGVRQRLGITAAWRDASRVDDLAEALRSAAADLASSSRPEVAPADPGRPVPRGRRAALPREETP